MDALSNRVSNFLKFSPRRFVSYCYTYIANCIVLPPRSRYAALIINIQSSYMKGREILNLITLLILQDSVVVVVGGGGGGGG